MEKQSSPRSQIHSTPRFGSPSFAAKASIFLSAILLLTASYVPAGMAERFGKLSPSDTDWAPHPDVRWVWSCNPISNIRAPATDSGLSQGLISVEDLQLQLRMW